MFCKKKFLKDEIESNIFGSSSAEEFLKRLKLKYWFFVYLYVKYVVLVKYEDEKMIKFLVLDKCLFYRDFL